MHRETQNALGCFAAPLDGALPSHPLLACPYHTQFVKDRTAMKFRQTGVPARVCWPAYLEPAPVSSELVDGLRAIMGIYEAGPPPQRIRI